MIGLGRWTGIDAAESGAWSFGSLRDSENAAAADRGFPNTGFRIFRIVNRDQLQCAPQSEIFTAVTR